MSFMVGLYLAMAVFAGYNYHDVNTHKQITQLQHTIDSQQKVLHKQAKAPSVRMNGVEVYDLS